MTTITIDRAVVEQALEALTNCTSEYGHRCNRCDSEVDEGGKVVSALRAALAQERAEPVREPMQESALQAVAEKIGDQCAVWYGIGARDVEEVLREAVRYGLVRAAQAEPVQEPAAWAHPTQGFVRWRTDTILPDVVASYERAGWTPLYTAPLQRPPLTDEEIDAMWREAASADGFTTAQFVRNFARAIERKLEEKNRA